MQEINANDLMLIDGGGPVGDMAGDIVSAGAQAAEGFVKGYGKMVKSCYGTGRELGRFIRNR